MSFLRVLYFKNRLVNIKSSIILIIIVIFFQSCEKFQIMKDFGRFDERFCNYFCVYDSVNYRLFKDSITNNIDTISFINYEKEYIVLGYDGRETTDMKKYEMCEYDIKGFLHTNFTASKINYNVIEANFSYPYTPILFKDSIFYNNVLYLPDTTIINNTYFYNVICFTSSNKDFKFYVADKVGFVRFEYFDNGELINSKNIIL